MLSLAVSASLSSGSVSLTKFSLTSPNIVALRLVSLCALRLSVLTIVDTPWPAASEPRLPQLPVAAALGSLPCAYCTTALSLAVARNITFALTEPSFTATRFRPSITSVASSCWRSAPICWRALGSTTVSSNSLSSSWSPTP